MVSLFTYFIQDLANRTNFSKWLTPLSVAKVNALTVVTEYTLSNNSKFGWFVGVTNEKSVALICSSTTTQCMKGVTVRTVFLLQFFSLKKKIVTERQFWFLNFTKNCWKWSLKRFTNRNSWINNSNHGDCMIRVPFNFSKMICEFS